MSKESRTSHTRRPPLVHPSPEEFTLVAVLHALADPTRLTIVETLDTETERACGTFPVAVSPSTLSHHFRVLREAGVIHQRDEGNRRWTTLRRAQLDARFPGLIHAVLADKHDLDRRSTLGRPSRQHTAASTDL